MPAKKGRKVVQGHPTRVPAGPSLSGESTGPPIATGRRLARSGGVARGKMLPVGAIVVLDHTDPRIAARIVELQRASYAVEADLIGFDAIPTRLETPAQVARLDLTILGAVDDDGRLVGVLGYRRLGNIVEIDRLAVDPPWFRRGIARSLIEEVHRHEADATAFAVSTGAGNTPAITLYEKLGYAREPDVPSSSGPNLARFARRAGPPVRPSGGVC